MPTRLSSIATLLATAWLFILTQCPHPYDPLPGKEKHRFVRIEHNKVPAQFKYPL